ncbi:thiamine-phosphate pyrophosphorylase [Salinibacillus kushneri]|uniref:Thiamine-phosphate synthase n=1 Tax=Salinibacillus kushneri TaxID=237682 RepID=A0A1I0JI76_9BACI|nr:thiamine phosphate synthase [Salinibacillus kushneri]SEU09934.1 thiamine-phosphate pyrophosphorylase [Salinibacillus kushneri]
MKQQELEEYLSLYFIMGSVNCSQDPVEVLKQAIDGGITLFQYREKGEGALQGNEKYRLGEKLKKVCLNAGIPFIINDDVNLGIALDADGIHVGQDDEAAHTVQQKMGNKILGVSTHTIAEARKAVFDGADYIGVGPIFPTRSKDDANKVQGIQILQQFREQQITLPMVGIGGITAANAKQVIDAGANGVSVISAIAGADNVKQAALQLKSKVL